ncbi:hypothetical protein M4D52_14805 [Paenibacillus lactis]|uniref:hypothetical protein n=1 Tax=Paenibacillus lactis TaxID=228574 RepID=UPI0020414216|nr:hypothetical protein [Paenibacillus lactis]MCM3494706.1 hypothetical protein [Paenibacillus lactis]
MKVVYFNDTGKEINIHPGTLSHGTKTSTEPIKPFEERVFELPEGTYPWIMMCEHNDQLSIFVSGKQCDEQEESLDEEYDDEDEYYEDYEDYEDDEEYEEYADEEEESGRARRIKAVREYAKSSANLGAVLFLAGAALTYFTDSKLPLYAGAALGAVFFLISLVVFIKSFRV